MILRMTTVMINADDWVTDLQTERDDDRAGDDGEADEAVGAERGVAVGINAGLWRGLPAGGSARRSRCLCLSTRSGDLRDAARAPAHGSGSAARQLAPVARTGVLPEWMLLGLHTVAVVPRDRSPRRFMAISLGIAKRAIPTAIQCVSGGVAFGASGPRWVSGAAVRSGSFRDHFRPILIARDFRFLLCAAIS